MAAAGLLIHALAQWAGERSSRQASDLEITPERRTIGVLGTGAELDVRTLSQDGGLVRGDALNWRSSAPHVATVDPNGLVTGIRIGTARIIASIGPLSDTTVVTVRDAARLAWKFFAGGRIAGSISLTADGAVLVGSLGPSRKLHLLGPDGRPIWQLPLMTYGTPAIADNGVAYVGTAQGSVVAVSPDGTMLWTKKLGSKISSSPVSTPQNWIYVATVEGVLHALDASGLEKWQFEADSEFGLSTPAIGNGGRIHVGDMDGFLYAIDPDGALAWKFATGGAIQASPVIGVDGTIYVGSSNHRLYAIRPDGTVRWSFEADREVLAAAALDASGRILFGSVDGRLYALQPDGTLLWYFEAEGPIVSGPVIGEHGISYVADADGRIYSLSRTGFLRWDFPTEGIIQATPAIDQNGVIYVGSYDGNIYALVESVSGSPSELAWPTFGGDPGNSGAQKQ